MAKIKNQSSDSHETRPKGIKKHHFERVYWPYIPIILAISVLLIVTSSSGSLNAAVRHPLGRVLSYSTSMSIGSLLADTNSQRQGNGVASLNLNGQLDAAAQAKADDMATRDYWSHYTPEGNPPWIFVNAQGYAYQKLGENLATGFSDEQSTINGWMASPPHRENLLDPTFSDVGFGYANNPDYTAAGGGPQTIVVAFYGKPKVLSASTSAPAPVAPANTSPPASQTPASQNPEPAAAPAPVASETPARQAATTSTPKAKTTPASSTSRIQLASPKASYGRLATKLAIALAIGLSIFYAFKHLRALRRYLLKGEAYATSHPLTDLGLVIIAGLLFIASQTVGLIQ